MGTNIQAVEELDWTQFYKLPHFKIIVII